MAAKTPFDHLNAIYTDQSVGYFDNLSEADQKSFNPYMINRAVSMAPDFVNIAAYFSRFFGLVGARETYLFYSQMLPKGKRFDKYIKADKAEKYEGWLLDLVARYFSVSKHEATGYLGIFYSTDEGKADLKRICEIVGTDPKKIKKAKLS